MFMMDKITAAMGSGDYLIGIFLNFSKAFDTVIHDILLEKLCHYGIRGNALEWFEIESDKTTSIYNVSTRVLSKK